MVGEFTPLQGIRRADAVIVGGGLTGLMTADRLSASGMKVIVLDALEPGRGASALCTGSATLLCAPVYERIAALHGPDAARQHADMLRALLSSLPSQLGPLAPLREAESYVYAFLPRDLPALDEQAELLRRLSLPVSFAPDAGGCPFPVEKSLLLRNQLLVDVPPLLEALLRRIRRQGGQVFGHSRALALEGSRVCTREGCVDALIAILACGKPPGAGPSGLLNLLESRTMLQCRLSAQVPLHTCQQSVRPDGLSLRPVPGGAIASFCAGRSGSRAEAGRIALFRRILDGRLKDWEPGELQVRQELWPLDGLPVIGALPGTRGRVLCAAGYSGHGLLGAALAAQVLTRIIAGRNLPQDGLYTPDRPLPRSLLRQSLRAARKDSRWPRVKALAALTPPPPRCTLCRTPLRYCPPATLWECPVCGSAYGMLGAVQSGPALLDADISARQRPDL